MRESLSGWTSGRAGRCAGRAPMAQRVFWLGYSKSTFAFEGPGRCGFINHRKVVIENLISVRKTFPLFIYI